LISRICTAGANLHRLDLPDMNPIGLLQQQQELRRYCRQIDFLQGKKITGTQQWNSRPYRQARAERSAVESLLFSLKEGFEFGELVRRTYENVLAEMLEKVLAYNISQIIRLRKKLSESEQIRPIAA
jgi:hypothetical protein